MYLLLIFLPLLSALSLLLFGRLLGQRGALIISLCSILCSFLCAFFIFVEVALMNSFCLVLLPFF